MTAVDHSHMADGECAGLFRPHVVKRVNCIASSINEATKQTHSYFSQMCAKFDPVD